MARRNPESHSNARPQFSRSELEELRRRPGPLDPHTFNPRKDLLMAKNIKPALDAINIDSKYIGIYTDMGKESRRKKNPIR